jgi:hypothetical protein
MSPCTLHDVINAIDESITTIQHLAELGPAIELLALIAQQAAHVEKLSTQLARCVLPRPRAVEGTP